MKGEDYTKRFDERFKQALEEASVTDIRHSVFTTGDTLKSYFEDIEKVGYYYSKKRAKNFIRIKLKDGRTGKAWCHPDDEFNPAIGIVPLNLQSVLRSSYIIGEYPPVPLVGRVPCKKDTPQ
jgi:hypothetical protein